MRRSVMVLLLAFTVCADAADDNAPKTNTIRVMTFNIHHGQGVDGKLDLGRIAALIKTEKADVVALQEVDSGTARTSKRDLPSELGKLTGMNSYFGKNLDYQGGGYGNAVLSRFPILGKTNTHYQMVQPHEQRGLVGVALEIDGRKLLFMSTHLDYHNDDAERVQDVKAIRTAVESFTNAPAILCGDFNEGPGSRTYNRLSEFLTDTWKQVGKGSGFTFSSSAPWQRIDYIWYAGKLRPVKTWIPKSNASDHLPLVAEFSLE